MLFISRNRARQLHSVFRKAGFRSRTNKSDTVFFAAGAEGCRIVAVQDRVMVEYHLSGRFDPMSFNVPLSVFADASSRKQDEIRFDVEDPEHVTVSWYEARVPKRQVYTFKTDSPPLVAATPQPLATIPAGLLKALGDATEVAAHDSTRFALNCLRLSGSKKDIAATDGSQLLIHGGIDWPWAGEVIVRANPVFHCPELPQEEPVTVGCLEDRVLFRVGNWSIWLVIEKDARFPRVEDLVQRADTATATLTISAPDSKFLATSLPQLPSDNEYNSPVTIDLNGRIAVRAKPADKETTTELVLANSQYVGTPVRVNTNRNFLQRALRFGFSTLSVFDPSVPLQCQDAQRTLLWSVLDPKQALAPTDDGVRIESSVGSVQPSSPSSLPRKRIAMIANSQTSSGSTKGEKSSPKASSVSTAKTETASPIEQAVTLRAALRDTLSKTNDLIRSLKRQKQQSRLVQATLASLRQLQGVGT